MECVKNDYHILLERLRRHKRPTLVSSYAPDGSVSRTIVPEGGTDGVRLMRQEGGGITLCEPFARPQRLILLGDTEATRHLTERAAVRQDSVLRLYVLQTLSQHYLDAVDGLRRATTQTIDKRLCGLLLSMAGPYARDEDSEVLIGEAFSQKTIAIMLNANRITITRTMQKLREVGLLRPSRNQHYRIASLRQLRAYMEA